MTDKTVGAAGATGTFDYTCDGTGDETEIAAAIAAVYASHGTVYLSAGTFHCTYGIPVAVGVSLVGTAGTVIAYTGASRVNFIAAGSNTISGVEFAGPVVLSVRGSNVTVSGCTSRQALYGIGAFEIDVVAGLVENVLFEDCDAIDTSGFGFIVNDTAAGDIARNITFRRCTATNCGARNDLLWPEGSAAWICGFDLGEGAATFTIDNILVEDCTATGAWENGFYAEPMAQATNCRIVRCTSADNGSPNPAPVRGGGFVLSPGWEMVDCVSRGDTVGSIRETHPTNYHEGTPLKMTRCTVINPALYGVWIHGTAGSSQKLLQMADCTIAGVTAGNPYLKLDNVENGQITNLRLVDNAGTLYEYNGTTGTVLTYYLEPFTIATAAPVTGEAIAFTDASENDGLTAWAWDFGDGSGSAAQHPTHAYPSAGVYPVTLAAGGNVVSQTVTVTPGVSYGGARLSEADIGPLDHDPVANATDLHSGRIGLQGSPVSRKAWTIDALADDHAEIEAVAALKGQRLTLNINGVEYPGVMIRPPMLETQLTPAAWAYQIGFVQETRR